MRLSFVVSMISALLLSAFSGKAQNLDGLSRDAKGRYVFTHTSMTPSATKEQMYDRMKPFITGALNASDNFVAWDESGYDSVKTVAFLELGNSGGDIINQVVDYKARFDFREGEVTLRLSGFNYSGIVEGKTYGLPLHRLDALPYYAESFAMLSLEQALRELAEKMDAAAAGITKNQTGKKAKR